MINGFIISYDIRSVDVLVNDNLKWKNLETSRSLVNATLMYKIVLMINLSPSNSPLQNDSSTNHDNLRNLETDLALPRPKTNFLKSSFKYNGAMRWNNLSYEAKQHDSFPNLKPNLRVCLLPGSLRFLNLCVNILKPSNR